MLRDLSGRSVAPRPQLLRRRARWMVRTVPAIGVLSLACTLAGAAAARADGPFIVRVGVPNLYLNGHLDVGGVQNSISGGGAQALTERQFGLGDPGQPSGDRFGASLAVADLNGDGYDDVVVGVPGTAGIGVEPGHVDLLFGSATGIRADNAVTLASPAVAGDEFGSAVTVVSRFDDTGQQDLWVGAPDHDVNGKANAGAIFRYVISPTGVASYLQTITQDSPLVPGAAEAGDRFGEVLAPALHGVVIGVPDEDIGAAKDAGAFYRLRVDPSTSALIQSSDWNQNSTNVPGAAEAGDRFGAAVSYDGYAIGVPGEDLGKIKDAGEIQTFGYSTAASDTLAPAQALAQNSPGVPGAAEPGDRFGAALITGTFNCGEVRSAAVGAPGEDIGSIKDAGTVTLIALPFFEDRPCPAPLALGQGAGLPGAPEAGDELGAAVGNAYGDPTLAEDEFDQLMIGIPGEDIGTAKTGLNVGRVTTWFHGPANKPGTTHSLGYAGGDVVDARYGSVFPNQWR